MPPPVKPNRPPTAPAPSRVASPLFTPIEPQTTGMPLFRSAKRALLREIESGQLPPGEALPSEAVLASALGISVGTLRHAVDELVAEHILVRRQGRGTFVATHNADRFLFQFFHVERSDGLSEVPQVELLGFEQLRLDDDAAAEALALKPGEPVLRFENRLQLQGRDREVFVVIYLDAQNRVLRVHELFAGTLTQTSVYPREVVKGALASNAAAVIFAHNHPSGIAEPSHADEALTQALKQALALVDIRVLDHVVIGRGAAMSFAERGIL